ncbi:hypothetical protein OKW50_004834 [Paraburkholderia youngii]
MLDDRFRRMVADCIDDSLRDRGSLGELGLREQDEELISSSTRQMRPRAHGVIRSTCSDIRRASSGLTTPMCRKKKKLHDATRRHTRGKRRDFDRREPIALRNFVAGQCGQVRPQLSKEDMVLRVEAVKPEKIR